MNFPILIDITDKDLAINAQSDGDDICFLDTQGIQLSHEIELYNAGHLVAWVKVANLSSSVDTMLYMYYGNAAAENQEDPHGVWDSNYMMVQHLSETSGTHYDSTANGNNGSPVNGVAQGTTGKIDGADNFDGTNDCVTVSHSSTITGFTQAFTASFWVQMDSITGRRTFLNKWNTNSQRAWYIDYDSSRGASQALGLFVSTDGTTYSYWYAAFSPVVGTWYHIAVVWRSGQQPIFYVNGAAVTATTSTVRASIYDNSLEPLYIGRSYVGGRFFDGVIDEVRISNVARSAQWIQTCYNNQMNPSSFYTIGSVIFEPQAPKVSDPYPYDGETDVSISLNELDVTVSDSNGDLMNITGTTDPDIGSSEGFNLPDTPFTIPVSGLNYGTTYTWHVNVTDGTFWTNMTYYFTTESKPILKSKALTIDHSLVAGNLVNFPILIDIMDNDLTRDAQPDGSDIYFTNDNGSQISHEIELYNDGHLVAWVKVPNLPSSANTTLYMCYGAPGAGDPENPAGVWDSNFMMVQHLGETSGTHYDSTVNGNNGSPVNGVVQGAAGKIDGADDFDGTNDYIVVPHSGTITGFTKAFTASFWIKMDSITGRRTLLNKWNTASSQRAWYIDYDSSRGVNTLGLFISPDGSAYSYWYAAFSPVAGSWYHIAVVW